MQARILSVLITILLFVLTGCRASNAPRTYENLQITLENPQPRIGKGTVIVILQDARNIPIENATVEVIGDMTHAGMAPVTGKVTNGKEGRYEIPFDWNMGGDWVLTINVALPDGSNARKMYPITVKN